MKALLRRLLSCKHEDLYLDLKRVNVEVQAERRRELDEDPEYRARVMRRMREGYACPLPPLYKPGQTRRGDLVVFRGSWGA